MQSRRLTAYGIVQKAPVVMFLDIVARFPFQRFETPVVINHPDIALVVVIHLPQAVLQPADHRLRPVETEIGETVPDAGERHLQRRGQARVGKAGKESERIFLMNVRPGLLRIQKVRLAIS